MATFYFVGPITGNESESNTAAWITTNTPVINTSADPCSGECFFLSLLTQIPINFKNNISTLKRRRFPP